MADKIVFRQSKQIVIPPTTTDTKKRPQQHEEQPQKKPNLAFAFGSSSLSMSQPTTEQKAKVQQAQPQSSKPIFGSSTGISGFAANKKTADFDQLLQTEQEEQKESQKLQLSQQEQRTGEEEDTTLLRARVSVKVFEKEWKQRGTGPLHLNRMPNGKYRLVCRSSGTMALLLNVSLFMGMTLGRSGEKTLIIGAIQGKEVVSYAYQFENKETCQLWYKDLLAAINGGTMSFTQQQSQPAVQPESEPEDSSSDPDSQDGEYDEYVPGEQASD